MFDPYGFNGALYDYNLERSAELYEARLAEADEEEDEEETEDEE